ADAEPVQAHDHARRPAPGRQGETRTTKPAGGPGTPFESRSRTMTVVSPRGNPKAGAIDAQNCILLSASTKPKSPSAKRVHASADIPRPIGCPLPSMNRQAKSLMAFEIA